MALREGRRGWGERPLSPATEAGSPTGRADAAALAGPARDNYAPCSRMTLIQGGAHGASGARQAGPGRRPGRPGDLRLGDADGECRSAPLLPGAELPRV